MVFGLENPPEKQCAEGEPLGYFVNTDCKYERNRARDRRERARYAPRVRLQERGHRRNGLREQSSLRLQFL